MKRFWFLGWLMLALPWTGRGASAFYVNDGVVLSPPQIAPVIDATNFVNNNWFEINSIFDPYETSSTVYYTNRGTMISSYGFRFETTPSGSGQRRRAGSLFNNGRIDATFKLLANATNIVCPGEINMGFGSLLSLSGGDLNLNRAKVTSQTAGSSFVIVGTNIFLLQRSAILDGYWNAAVSDGSNTAHLNPAVFNFLPTFTPFHLVTNRDYSTMITFLSPPNQVAYVNDVLLDESNRVVSAVFLANTNPAFTVNVYFPFPHDTWVEWRSVVTNAALQPVTNWIYLRDTFGVFTNLQVAPNGFAGSPTRATYKPVNYSFFTTGPRDLGPPTTPGLPPGTFDTSRPVITNEFSAYEARFEATTELIEDVVGRNITNLSGRVELRADGSLSLSNARIAALNYTLIQATNHFVGSKGAQIVSPWMDIHLRTTNGNLAITNLVAPVVPNPEGVVRLWSARWTNDVNGVINSYHVLVVDSRLAPTLPPRIQSMTLRCTNNVGGGGNILISDVLNVTSNLLIETERLTILSNAPGSVTRRGEIRLLSGEILWSTATPRLRYLTNNGAIESLNAIFFGGSRGSPFFSTNFNEPYGAMVNRGDIFNYGSLIWADYFENSGAIRPFFGSVELYATNAFLHDGTFEATNGDVFITTGRLVATNHSISAGRVLWLTPTNFLDDGTFANLAAASTNVTTQFLDPTSAALNTSVAMISNPNYWIAGDGVTLGYLPPVANLLGTTIEALARPNREVTIRWAGADRGCTPAGFSNNAALGRLILNGDPDSLFIFEGTGVSNALYVDRLEFRGYNTTTLFDSEGNVKNVQINENMKIYFADALADDGSVAVRTSLNNANGGRFCWVYDFAGFYSATNFTYPGESVATTLNRALVLTPDLDSDGDGIENRSDPSPVPRPQDIAVTVAVLGGPTPKVELSWPTFPNALNRVYYKTAANTNWLELTNFVSSPTGGRVSILDPIQPTGLRYYRVRLDRP